MNNKRIIIGVTIGIIAAILWSVVFINVLNSMAGIGIGICLGISFGISGSLIFSKKDKDKWWYNFKFVNLPFEREESLFSKGLWNIKYYVKIHSITSGQFQSGLPIFKNKWKW